MSDQSIDAARVFQSVGRLHRQRGGKTNVLVIDYIEGAVPVSGIWRQGGGRLVEWIDHLARARQRTAPIARKLATVATVHGQLGTPSAVSSSMVRDAAKGMRRRLGKAQRQTAGLRLGEAIGNAPVKGFTLAGMMEACGADLPALRNAALLSLGYHAGLRVSEMSFGVQTGV